MLGFVRFIKPYTLTN